MKTSFFIIALVLLSSKLGAQENTQYSATIELNTVHQEEAVCRLSFTVQARKAVDKLILETVLFDARGAVKMLTLFDFNGLPAQKMRVRQFDIPETKCENIGRVLFNGIDRCEGPACDDFMPNFGSRLSTLEVLG